MGIALSKAIVFVSVCVCFLKLNKAQRCMESNYGIPNRTKNCWIKLFSWFSIELLFACSIQYYFLSLLFHYFILQILPIPIIARKRKKKKNRELSGRQAINLRLQQASIFISLWVIGFTLQQVLLLVSFFSSIFTFLAIIFAFRMYVCLGLYFVWHVYALIFNRDIGESLKELLYLYYLMCMWKIFCATRKAKKCDILVFDWRTCHRYHHANWVIIKNTH